MAYRYCHFPIDNAGPQHKIHVARSHYDENWLENARCYDQQGCYDWMASQLKPFQPTNILDIGCGDGRGLLALAKAYPGLRAISLDENPHCLQRATKTLRNARIKVQVVRRLETVILAPECHALQIHLGKLRDFHGVTLIEGDIILDDEELSAFLRSRPKLDAITVWLIGTHSLRYQCFQLRNLPMDNPSDYRLWVYNYAYRLANELLKVGGVLHIVDRGAAATTEDIYRDRLNSHKEIAQTLNTTLDVQQHIEFKPYTESTAAKRTPMIAYPGTGGKKADMSSLVMNSILAVKR